MLLVSRVLAGICGANLSVASAYVADITPPEKRSSGVGMVIGMGFGLGFIFGPLIGGLSNHFLGEAAPGWVAASICLFNFIAAFFILAESRSKDAKPPVKRSQWAQWAHTLKQPKLGILVLLVFLATICFACFETTLPLLLVKHMDFEETQLYYLMAYSGFIAAMVQGGAIRKLVHRYGEKPLILASFFGLTASFVLIPLGSSMAAVLGSLAIYAFFSGINRPPLTGLISIISPDNEQGANLGVSQSASAIGRIIGPPLATSLYFIQAPMPYWVCAGIALVAGLIAMVFLTRLLADVQGGKGGGDAPSPKEP